MSKRCSRAAVEIMVAKMDATMLRLDFVGAMVAAITHGSKLKLSLDELVPHGIDPHGVVLVIF